jgi:signal transduction histidine kinase
MKLTHLLQKIRSKLIRQPVSLRLLVTMGITLPILVFLTGLSVFHYWQEYRLLKEQERFSATQLGTLLSHSISHSLRNKDGSALIATFSEIGQSENVMGIEIIGEKGHVLFASDMKLSASATNVSEAGCWACHQYDAATRPRTAELDGELQGMRIATPISNEADCKKCHSAANQTLGVLILDVSLEELQKLTLTNLGRDIGISTLVAFMLMVFTYIFISTFVVWRIEAFRGPLSAYAAADFSARISEPLVLNDEIHGLANTINHMADAINQNAREQEDRGKLRQRAIIEERERIGRELHDGLAQVLGYVTNKAVAARLMLEKDNREGADRNLLQLEDSARNLMADMREDILGLRTASQVDRDLGSVLRDYIERYNHLSDRPVEWELPQEGEMMLDPSIVLQLTRIVQEALANVRKHAGATHTMVRLGHEGAAISLEVQDDGCGFDVESTLDSRIGRFGLSTMHERAEEIGASLTIDSQPGAGTTVRVRLEPK